MSLTNEQKADAQIKLFEKLTSYSLKGKGSVYAKPDLEKFDKKYLQKFTRFDELPPNSLYFSVPKDVGWLSYWAQYYPSGFEGKLFNNYGGGRTPLFTNHRYGEMGTNRIDYDNLQDDGDGYMDGWDYDDDDFYFFTALPLKNKPFLNWKQNNPWEVKE